MSETHRLVAVLDTDIGTDVDDVLALTLLANSPEFELVGITTVYGDAVYRARMARYFCDRLGRTGVPVVPGECETMSGDEVWWGGHEGEGIPGLADIAVDESDDAVSWLCEVARQHAGHLQIFAIGPLTNIGRAIQRDPGFAASVGHLFIMGGAYWLEQSEHNIRSDAEAAEVVFRSGIPITVCGLDVTTRVWIREDGVDLIQRSMGETGEVLAGQVRRWFRFLEEHGIASGTVTATHLHDPLAILPAVRPDLFSFEACDVSVGLEGDMRGWTRLDNCGSGAIRVVRDVDTDAAERDILSRIIGAAG
jgi:purine nucleosidase